jgi:uncharacterized membrane protein
VLSRVRTKLSDLAAAMDAFVTRFAHATPNLFIWPLLYAVTLGAGVFVIRHLSWVALLDTNKVPEPDTLKMVKWSGGTLAAVVVVYAVAAVVARLVARRRGAPPPSGGAIVAALNRRLRPLLAFPLFAALTLPSIERDSPKETFFLIALIAAVVGLSVYAWLPAAARLGPVSPTDTDAPPPPRPGRETAARIAAAVVVAALWAGYGYFFSRLAITNHHALHTSVIDLGYYDNIFWQSIHGHPLACSFIKAGYHGSAHFDPILVVLSPLYLLYPRAEFLLVLQSVFLGAGVVPVYLIARARLASRGAAVVLAVMYAVFPALHGANMYEFHSLSLVTPVLLWLLYFFEAGTYLRYWLLLLPALLVREDISLLTCFIGVYAILSRRPRAARLGWVTIAVCLAYFALVKRVFMTSPDIFNSGKDSVSFAYYYEDLIPNHNGMGGFLISLVTNPVFVLKTALAEAKILYVVTLFLPLLFLPFFARTGRVMLFYGLFFCLLASRSAVFTVHFQYSSLIIPIAFALTPTALRQIEDGPFARMVGLEGARLRRALLGAALVASLLVSWKFGGLLENTTFRGGFQSVARVLTDKERDAYAWIREQTSQIPPGASVGTTNHVGAHVSNRKSAVFYPEHPRVDWLFLDENELKAADLEKHNKAVQAGTFELVSRHDKLAIYKRKK